MISLAQAFTILEKIVTNNFVLTVESPTHPSNCLNRILAEDQLSKLDLPSFNKSAMDGFAIMADDEQDSYAIMETVPAGELPKQKLSAKQTAKVMTGAPVPENTGKVIPHEFTEESCGRMKIIKTPPPVTNICRRGEDVRVNDLVMPRGTIICPTEIANLIACGITTVKVFRRPRVIIISTGDEIVNDFTELAPGKIMNSNGPMLKALCSQHELDVRDIISIKDDYAETVKALQNALQAADIILLSGGVSAGEFDYVTKALSEGGLTIHFNRVAVKPGKPMTFAAKENKLVFGLPGNPVSVFLMFHLFVLRALRIAAGTKTEEDYMTLPLEQDYQRILGDRAEYVPCKIKTGRIEFAPCELQKDGTVIPLESHGSAHIAALLNKKTYKEFFLINQGVTKLGSGNFVQVIRLG